MTIYRQDWVQKAFSDHVEVDQVSVWSSALNKGQASVWKPKLGLPLSVSVIASRFLPTDP